ncbi:hypothetical protein [Butyrivibrio proteoclasticus]|uniref:hypothetical protein n=1 Tax=Butyrivibrio proteoclasticus TaxID=43305 RepID=UPI00047C206C|nr:hypothetical protein [Butyrivibrio proteoclasticus]
MELTFSKGTKKQMVKAIEEVTGEKAKYLGVPSCAYQIGDYRVEKDGTLKWEDYQDADPDHADMSAKVINACIESTGITPEGMKQEEAEEGDSLIVEVPADKVNVENIKRLIDAKGRLIKKALGTGNLEIEVTEDTVRFPWFENFDPDKALAYTNFIAALCQMSVNQTRISAKETEVPNEKYAFRCFLLRLGFIGDEYKKDRKILLENLDGNSAFRQPREGDEA